MLPQDFSPHSQSHMSTVLHQLRLQWEIGINTDFEERLCEAVQMCYINAIHPYPVGILRVSALTILFLIRCKRVNEDGFRMDVCKYQKNIIFICCLCSHCVHAALSVCYLFCTVLQVVRLKVCLPETKPKVCPKLTSDCAYALCKQ